MEPEVTTTVRYRCTHADACTEKVGADCPGCSKITNTITKRAIPDCAKYIGEAGFWQEVYMKTTDEGQRFFHGTKKWVPDPEGELPGDMKEELVLGEMVQPFTDINGCSDDGRVRFFVMRFQ